MPGLPCDVYIEKKFDLQISKDNLYDNVAFFIDYLKNVDESIISLFSY